mmetsp:Transcript_24722/g.41804  ORF Transcript_24722/g.41804 Transcript_24722/m.41804 type:complete len:623 (+) Transcript_24722:84-1952(+)|eukprot:CAMPEP_0114465956 /NCGR_PEP_ID=MMETSP0104-20121206/8797_1 /TAXON_ID=37642 ORGANISM="Paraphysomonas imperforata, Strain PA2" /NCGR_SAMPLE_ID=MMETSP0104 /ASSEMBLY_ACC=CAM_ASM_000202 /LENGTH=622 /DNA_ID=CAMNT_0001639253 /DNA_START=37 /DNA_END=1905 /DNA_ORIENTATION=-
MSERESVIYSAGKSKVPLSYTGFLKKRGQRIKTWKRRYVALELGRLSYFEKSNGTEEPPYGIGLKGSLSLLGYKVEDGPKDDMLLLVHHSDKREMLIEVENGADDAANWRALLEHHIQYSNANPTFCLQIEASFQEDEAMRAIVANKFAHDIRSSLATPLVDEKMDSGDDQRAVMSAPVPFKLNPGFVIKSKRMDGMKIFVNVCDHETVPSIDRTKNRKRWPLIVMGPTHKVSVDKHAEECHVFDVCVNPSVMEECQVDATGEVKEVVCTKIMDAIIAQEKKEKMDNLIDKSVFSFPRLVKKFKGDEVAQFLIPRSIHENSKNCSVFTAIDVDNLADFEEEEEAPPVDEEYDPFAPAARQSTSDTTSSNKLSSAGSGRNKNEIKRNSVFYNSGIPKKFVTFNVERQTGAIIREKPSKTAKRIKTLLQGTKTFCYGLYTDSNNIGWYRVLDGWTAARTDGGQRMLKPVCTEQPQSVSITGANLTEKEESGVFSSTKFQILTYSIQLNFSRDSILSLLRLQRTYKDFVELRDGLLFERLLQAEVVFPDYAQEDLLNGVEMEADDLLHLMDDLDMWLRRIIEDVRFDAGPSIRKFLCATEADSKKIDVDLSAEGGLDGAWSMDVD